jgi:hypothetical protein
MLEGVPSSLGPQGPKELSVARDNCNLPLFSNGSNSRRANLAFIILYLPFHRFQVAFG